MEYELLLVLFVAFILFLTVADRINEKKRWRWLEAQHRDNYGKASSKKHKTEEWKTIASYYVRHKDLNGIDDITWNDLGMDEVFKKMDYTDSSVGEQFLYYMLRTPCYEEETLKQRGKRICGEGRGAPATADAVFKGGPEWKICDLGLSGSVG